MALEYRTVTNTTTGKKYEETLRDGVLESVKPLPLRQQQSKVILEERLLLAGRDWQTWKLMAAEATARAEQSAYIIGLDNRVEAAWDEVMSLIPSWVVIEID